MIQDESQTPVTPEGSRVPAGLHGLPSSWLIRGAWLLAGVVLPFICFLISYPEGPSWQSGGLNAYAQLLLSRDPSLAQYPFLLFSMTCMVLLVRSEEYLDPHGAAFRVNDQLRFLKGFELLLVSLSPRLHRVCRWIYDRVGPRLAGLMMHTVLADLGYMALKPAEWAAHACLALAIPGETELVRNIYRTDRRPKAGK